MKALEEKKSKVEEYLADKNPADYGAVRIGGDAYDTAGLIVIRLDKHGLCLSDGGKTEDVSDKSVEEIIDTIEEWAQTLREEDYATVTWKVTLHRSDAEDFKEELRDWLMSHRMGLESIEIEEE